MKKWVCALIVVVMMLSCTSALACTGYYVGKDASVDGTIMFGRTADAWTNAQSKITVVEASDEPGRTIVFGSKEYALPDVTYKYTTHSFVGGYFDNAVVNEYGVSMAGCVSTYVMDAITDIDPYVEDGVTEQWIDGYIAATCTTAREAVETFGEMVAEYGINDGGIWFIADTDEAWYIETYGGHQWVAVLMPSDCVAVFGNENMLRTLEDWVEDESLLHSEDLYNIPEEAGTAVYDDNGYMDLFYSYTGDEYLYDNPNLRTWYGHYLLAPSTAGEYDTKTNYDLFFQPDELVSLSDIFELTRTRYEGSEYDVTLEGNEDGAVRVIGIERQTNVCVVQIYPDLPDEMSTVIWSTMGNAEHAVFLPISELGTDVAEAYSYTPEDYVQEGVYFDGEYDLGMAHVHFKRLSALAELDRELYGASIREYWKTVEDALIEEYPTILAETLALYEEDPEAAAEYITNYTIEIQESALEDADTMYDELNWYIICNNLTSDHSNQEAFVTSLLETVEETEEVAAE